MLDEKEPAHDRRIAERVITNHRFQGASQVAHLFNDTTVIETKLEQAGTTQDGKGSTVYDKEMSTGNKNSQMVLTRDFLKKYISYVKSQKDPELSDATLSYTSECYAFLRSRAANYDQNKVSQPVTVRSLETIIRLGTAHAKLR